MNLPNDAVMSRRPSPPPIAAEPYWQRRLASPAFAREITRLIANDLRAVASLTFQDALDVDLLRDLIHRWDDLLAVDALAAIAVDIRKAVRRRLRRSKRSLHGILGNRLVAEIDSRIDDATNLSRYAEDFIERLMQRELIQSLMTDLIYTTIVSFNRRVNPLFGNLALMAIDAQIKSFIRMFMPMLQRQATGFLTDRKNHVLFADFARAGARQILNEPLPHLLRLLERDNDAEVDAEIGEMARDPQLQRLMRNLALTMLDTVVHEIGNRRVGSVLQLDGNVGWLAKRLTEPVLAVLARPHVAAFINREIERASQPAIKPLRKTAVAPATRRRR